VITYDRRGFGASDRPSGGYDYDTFTDDLHVLVEKLDLREVALVGFSMGTGEIARYLGRFGTSRVRKTVLLAPIPPFLLRTDDNPLGLDQASFASMMASIIEDRPAYLKRFLDNVYNVDAIGRGRISKPAWEMSWNGATSASPIATLACVQASLTDFRDDLPAFDVPTLVIQGVDDRILPIAATGRRLPELIKDMRLIEINGAPHGIIWTHSDEVNEALLAFLS
jgi:non-heme chloroperoxidase